MVGIVEIQGALASLQTAFNIAKGLHDLKRGGEIQAAVSDIQAALMDAQSRALQAQSSQSALIDRVGELEAEVARLKAWDADKQRYQLQEIARGVFAYVLKPDAQPSEPPHKLCVQCYQSGQKSILQRVSVNLSRSVYEACSRCGAQIYTHGGPDGQQRRGNYVR